MKADDIKKLKVFLNSCGERDLTTFLKDNNERFIGSNLSLFPDTLRSIKSISDGCTVEYPNCSRDNFNKDEGIVISYFDKAEGKFIYLGNLSVELTIKKSSSKFNIVGYSYKYWFTKNSYILSTEKESFDKINFNIRFDWDSRHKSEGLEYHTTFLHTLPRTKGVELKINDFLSYLKKEIIPLSYRVANGIDSHIGLVNNR